MANWVKCTSPDDSAVKIWVNLEQIAYLSQDASGTSLRYSGAPTSVITVAESPEEILKGEKFRDA